MPRPFLLVSQSDYLIQTVDIKSHVEWQTVQIQISWLLRSQLIWIYTVFKDRVYPGSAGQGLRGLNTLGRFSASLVMTALASRSDIGNNVRQQHWLRCWWQRQQCEICALSFVSQAKPRCLGKWNFIHTSAMINLAYCHQLLLTMIYILCLAEQCCLSI